MTMSSDVQLIHGEAFAELAKLPSGSVDLIVTDPPYYRIVRNKWDNQWASKDDFFRWIERLGGELARVLKPSGSLYFFCDEKRQAYVQVELDKHFSLINSLVWEKPSSIGKNSPLSRSFTITTERILFYEQAAAPGLPKTGLEEIHSRPDCFTSLKAYMRGEKAKMMQARGWTLERQFDEFVRQVTGKTAMHRHYFVDSQWRLPTAEHYAALQTGGFFRREYEDLRREYEDLRREYEDLRREYEDLRRPWNFTEGSEEILRFSGVQGVRKIHPTQKPLELLQYLIERSSNPGALVLDPFAGSGSTLKAAQLTGRRAIGIEMDAEYCQRAQAWLDSAEMPQKRARKSRKDNLPTDGEQLLLGLF